MQVTVYGDADFKKFKLACHIAAGPDFDRHLDHGLKRAGEDLGQAVITASTVYMPSGYELLFQSRARAQVDLMRQPARGMTLTVYARGRVGRREVERMEKGVLRHPVFGRYRRLRTGVPYKNPWSVTHIRPGFFSEPIRFATPRALRRLDDALGDILNEVERLG